MVRLDEAVHPPGLRDRRWAACADEHINNGPVSRALLASRLELSASPSALWEESLSGRSGRVQERLMFPIPYWSLSNG